MTEPSSLSGRARSAEAALRELGFAGATVDDRGEVARVVLAAHDLARATVEADREAIVERVTSAGFRFVALDLGVA